jgi:hypothetical protein
MVLITPLLVVNENYESVLRKYDIAYFAFGLIAWSKKYTEMKITPSIDLSCYTYCILDIGV